jgi:hypothetical protein
LICFGIIFLNRNCSFPQNLFHRPYKSSISLMAVKIIFERTFF